MKKILSLFATLACAVVVAVDPPIPEICAWDPTPEHCPAYAKLYPLDYLAGDYTICENLPGLMMMHTNSGKLEREAIIKQADRSELVLELPDFLRLEGVCIYAPRNGGYPRYPMREEKVSRDGETIRRYTVTLDEEFGRVPPHRHKQQICIHAEPGSAGSRGVIRWAVSLGGKKQSMRSCPVLVLPPWEPSGLPTEGFFPMVWIAASTSDFHAEARTMIDYWGSLSKRVSVYDRRPRATIAPDIYADMNKRFERTMFLMYNHGMIDLDLPDSPQSFYSDVAKGKYRDKLPMNKLVDGRIVNSLPLWYMVEDPDGLYGKYLAEGFRGIAKNYPEIKELIWDYEYNNICYDDGSLERFGKFLGLDRPATFDEVRSHTEQFVAWKTVVSCRLVDKVNAAMREHLPGVRLVMCSTIPKPKKADNSALANAQRYSDNMVDAHLPMAYHAGLSFFSKVDFCTSILKKPFIALNNPAERYSNWFDRYTPQKIKQNIVAAAALRCGGFGFWPNDMLTGSCFTAVSEAFADVARVEKFYRDGKRLPAKEYKVVPAVRPSVEVDGESVFPATMIRDLRCVVHELDGERLLTILNYSPYPCVAEVALPEPRAVSRPGIGTFSRNGEKVLKGSFSALVSADGYALYRLTSAPADNEKEIPLDKFEERVRERRRELRERDPFAALRSEGSPFKLKRHFSAHYHMLEMDNGKAAVLIDQSRGGNVRGVEVKGVKQLFTGRCHFGKLYFVNAANFTDFSGFVFAGTERRDGVLTAVFRATVWGDPPARHELDGLEIVKRVSLDADNTITVEFTFRNTSKRTVVPDFRVHNILCAGGSYLYVNGKKLTAANTPGFSLYTRGAKELPFLVGRAEPVKWNGKPVRLDARRNGVKYRWHVDAPDYSGIFINNNRFFTVEPLSGRFTLKPGESRTFRLAARVELP